LGAAILAVKEADRDLKREITRQTRTTLGPIWLSEMQRFATSRWERATYFQTPPRVTGVNPPTLVAAQSTRPTRGGFVPASDFWQVEFGGYRGKTAVTYKRRSRKGTVHKVTRDTDNQLPARRHEGRAAYPALNKTIPRLVSLWVATVIRCYYDRLDTVGV
jgi:hypothetical protein